MSNCLIRNREYYKQVNDFSGLSWGTKRPTDLDLCIEFDNEVFILGELKFADTPLPTGQRLALERFIDSFTRDGKKAIALIAKHHSAPEDDIDVASCQVVEYRFNFKWKKTTQQVTIKQFVDWFLMQYSTKV